MSLRRMISIEMSIRPWVCDCSGLFFNVQLMNIALRSEKSVSFSAHICSCCSFRAMEPLHSDRWAPPMTASLLLERVVAGPVAVRDPGDPPHGADLVELAHVGREVGCGGVDLLEQRLGTEVDDELAARLDVPQAVLGANRRE